MNTKVSKIVVDPQIRTTFRRSEIINYLVACRVLSCRQINQLVFEDTNYGKWKCRVELKALNDAKMIERGRCMSTNDYVYWVGRQPKQVDHIIGVNGIWLSINQYSNCIFEREYDFGVGISDAFCIIENRPYFIEYQRSINHTDIRNKVPKYEQYALSRKWDNKDWPMPGKFARVVIVVESEKDRARTERAVKDSSVKFIVCLINEVKEVIS